MSAMAVLSRFGNSLTKSCGTENEILLPSRSVATTSKRKSTAGPVGPGIIGQKTCRAEKPA
jgi:hypothetical protein